MRHVSGGGVGEWGFTSRSWASITELKAVALPNRPERLLVPLLPPAPASPDSSLSLSMGLGGTLGSRCY